MIRLLDLLNVCSYHMIMDVRERLEILSEAAAWDDCVDTSDPVAEGRGLFSPQADAAPVHRSVLPCVSHHTTPEGVRQPVLKVLQTSACVNNCNYCAFRAGRDVRRTHVTPDELARSFDLMHRAGLVEGMFLSSGIVTTNRTMDEMLATAELTRNRYGFRGYLHIKLLPNAETAHVERAVQLADRVSVNMEGPTQEQLAFLAPKKRMSELLAPLQAAAKLRRKLTESGAYMGRTPSGGQPWGNARLGLSTQFVVGPAGESDAELLAAVQSLYRELRLSRAYYSAFTPVSGTPLEGVTRTDPRREHRLYQADWLLRFYGFDAAELPLTPEGHLRTDVDPKAAWARAHPERFPIEVNRATLQELLRIPGIGPQSARAIIAARRVAPLREIGDLRRLGARAADAAPYVLLHGRRPPVQLPLIERR